MSKPVFLVGLLVLWPVFALAVQFNRTQADYWELAQQALALEGLWLILANFGWLGTRWQRGHWDANALSASSDRRRFLLVGICIGDLLSMWGGYVSIIERVIW